MKDLKGRARSAEARRQCRAGSPRGGAAVRGGRPFRESGRMEMYFCPLFSGSSGNALFCQYGNTRLLIDAGKPGRQIEEALRIVI